MRRDARGDAVVPAELRSILDRVAVRLAAASAYQVLARLALIGAGGLWFLGLASLVVPLTLPWGVAGAVLAASLAVAFPVLLWHLRPSPLVAARVADHRLDLADRLGTAVDLLGRREGLSGLARLQVAETLECARTVAPRSAAPLWIPREAWIAAAAAASFVLWAQFLAGLTLPATPAARTAAAIHREGSRLLDLGRRIDEVGRARGFPETRRTAPLLVDLGRALTSPRVDRQSATGLLRDTARRLGAVQDALDRRLLAISAPHPDTGDAHAPQAPGTGAQRLAKLEAAMREVEALSGRLRSEGPGESRDLAQRLRSLSESLDRAGDVPVAARRKVAAAARDVEQGRLPAGAEALGQALQDLKEIERMLGDAQVLSEARREVQSASERIAGAAMPGGQRASASADAGPPDAPSLPGPGSTAVVENLDVGPPPPPGPNQGSLPGEGTGTTPAGPTPRLQGTRVPTHLTGIPGEGGAAVREITAPGQIGAARLPARPLPADVMHKIDRAASREPLPPAYLDIIRRYFEMLAGVP